MESKLLFYKIIRNKKGLSEVMATVLIIMLTIVGIAIVSRYVIIFVNGELPKSSECVDYANYMDFQESFEFQDRVISYNCYNSANNLHAISVKSGNMDETKSKYVRGFKLVFSDSVSSSGVEVMDGVPGSCELNGIKMIGESCENVIKIPGVRESRTYVYNSTKIYNSVAVYPIIQKEGRTRVCDKSGEIKLIECTENIN